MNLTLGKPAISVQRITAPLDRLCVHPENPNQMSPADFKKLKGIIERTGVFPTIIARSLELSTEFPEERNKGLVQILDGRHRRDIAGELGRTDVNVDLWVGVDDAWARIFLADLNRLNGDDVAKKRASLLRRIQQDFEATNEEMAQHFVPETAREMAKLEQLASMEQVELSGPALAGPRLMSIFVSEAQEQIIKGAIERRQQAGMAGADPTAIEGAALSSICTQWLEGQ